MMGTKREHSQEQEQDAIVCKKVAKIDDGDSSNSVQKESQSHSDITKTTVEKTATNKTTASTMRKQSIAEKLRAIKEKISKDANNNNNNNNIDAKPKTIIKEETTRAYVQPTAKKSNTTTYTTTNTNANNTDTNNTNTENNDTLESIQHMHKRLGIKTGARIYVKWDVCYEGEEPPVDDPNIEPYSDTEDTIDVVSNFTSSKGNTDTDNNNNNDTGNNKQHQTQTQTQTQTQGQMRVKWFVGDLGEKHNGIDYASSQTIPNAINDKTNSNSNSNESNSSTTNKRALVLYDLHYDDDPQFEVCI